ncbi:hypothetical protein AV530_004615 [Patagioenas fasciata monilis]|uniref:Uncharacterized protein n=1 Tax=Patagioenas fasciata monilis TaxID=372326 RepID=A0A1V4KHQ8_PATFA|nr:hypothetical protein AV530_004615 [Patagioenas fasciata monilis]
MNAKLGQENEISREAEPPEQAQGLPGQDGCAEAARRPPSHKPLHETTQLIPKCKGSQLPGAARALL